MLLILMLTNFSPLTKLFLFVPLEKDLVFFSFVKGWNLFWFSKYNWSPKKESENCISGKSRYSLNFVHFSKGFLWCKSIHCEPTSYNCHIELPFDYSVQYHCIDHSQLCSLHNTKIHCLIPILGVHHLQVWRMIHESAFHSPHIQRPCLMHWNIFCKVDIETLDLGSFRYPQPEW